jgi:hypothetical protein
VHDLGHLLHAPVEEGLREAEHLSVARSPAHDPPQDVPAPLVGGEDPLADQEGRGPEVIDNHPQRDVVLGGGPVLPAACPGDKSQQGREEVGVEVVGLPLHHGGQPLQTHPGVDAGVRQGGELPGGVAVVLHEDQVPDLQVAVAVAADRALRTPAAHFGALVVNDLGAGAAGAGLAHGPEVVLLSEGDDPLCRQARDLPPEAGGLVVLTED